MSSYDRYQTPLGSRYASEEMLTLFSARTRAGTWRKIWLWLAEAQKGLGIDQITDEALEQMRAHLFVTDEAFEVAREKEKRCRHDVMAHIHAFGQDAPSAAGIIHLGATSCDITDNADLIFIRNGFDLLLPKLAKVISNLQTFALKYRDLPTLGFTHIQAAQPVTVGKRAAQWIHELVMDLDDIEHVRDQLRSRGIVGTTGTQASFMEIFASDGEKIDRLNQQFCEKAGFQGMYTVSPQTYTRKVDLRVANALSAFGATAQRVASDIRHLAHLREIQEPFEKDQIGSSAMAFKRNPMRSERITSLGRELMNKNANAAQTFAAQIFERTLDDSAIRRIDIPEQFLLADAICISLDNVTDGLVVYPKVIRAHIDHELACIAMENIIAQMVRHGANRQEAHEQMRLLSRQAEAIVLLEGLPNDLMDRIRATAYFAPVHAQLDVLSEPSLYVGRSALLTDRMCAVVDAKLARYRHILDRTSTAKLSI